MAEIITLKKLCAELKIEPRDARELLRFAASDARKNPELAKGHKPSAAWQWVKGTAAEKEARAVLSGAKVSKTK